MIIRAIIYEDDQTAQLVYGDGGVEILDISGEVGLFIEWCIEQGIEVVFR
jgi:hypothetical protein